jgi:hypothetical protein
VAGNGHSYSDCPLIATSGRRTGHLGLDQAFLFDGAWFSAASVSMLLCLLLVRRAGSSSAA